MLSQFKELARSHEPEAVTAAASSAAAVCRSAQLLFSSLDAPGKRPSVVAQVLQ
jgi:hypothetical protein